MALRNVGEIDWIDPLETAQFMILKYFLREVFKVIAKKRAESSFSGWWVRRGVAIFFLWSDDMFADSNNWTRQKIEKKCGNREDVCCSTNEGSSQPFSFVRLLGVSILIERSSWGYSENTFVWEIFHGTSVYFFRVLFTCCRTRELVEQWRKGNDYDSN